MKYVQTKNTGKEFITHEDREIGHMSGHPGNIYVVSDDHDEWIDRVNGTEKTLEESESIVLETMQQNWDENNRANETLEEKIKRLGDRPELVILPQ